MSVGGAPFLHVIWVVGDCCTFVSFNLSAWACYAFVSFNTFVFNSRPCLIRQVGVGHWASWTSMLLNMAVLSSPQPHIIRHSTVGLSHLCIIWNVRLGSGAGVCEGGGPLIPSAGLAWCTHHLVMPRSGSVWFFEDFEELRPKPKVQSKKLLNLEPDHRFRFSGFGSGSPGKGTWTECIIIDSQHHSFFLPFFPIFLQLLV